MLRIAFFIYFSELYAVINEVILGFEEDICIPLINLSFLHSSIYLFIFIKIGLIISISFIIGEFNLKY